MPRATMKPCPRCGSASVEMVQLDSGHWLGTCRGCDDCEGAIHWSKVAARRIWNSYTRNDIATEAHA